jgi:myo-inositol-1(or 4)-monophosphatase
MTVMRDLRRATEAAKKSVLENLPEAKVRTGDENPFGDATLLLDKSAEDAVISVLQEADTTYMILTEERGLVKPEGTSEYLIVLDPIDGSTNLERGIPLCSVGISAVPMSDSMSTDDMEASVIDSFFTNETYVAIAGKGASRNGRTIHTGNAVEPSNAIISYDTKKPMKGKFGVQSLRTLGTVYDIRRTGSNLLDLCWTASGALDAMVDLRGILPIVHVSGIHMVVEAGGWVLNAQGKRFKQSFDMERRMSFVAASNQELAESILRAFGTEREES